MYHIIYDLSIYLDTETQAFSWWLLLCSFLSLQLNLLLKKQNQKQRKNHKSNKNMWVMILVTQNADRMWHCICCSEMTMNSSMPALEIPELLSGITPGHWHFTHSPWASCACAQWAAPTLHLPPAPASSSATASSTPFPGQSSFTASCFSWACKHRKSWLSRVLCTWKFTAYLLLHSACVLINCHRGDKMLILKTLFSGWNLELVCEYLMQ